MNKSGLNNIFVIAKTVKFIEPSSPYFFYIYIFFRNKTKKTAVTVIGNFANALFLDETKNKQARSLQNGTQSLNSSG